jgi:hypothetical protein
MDKKITAFAMIAIIALVVAVIALGVAFTVISENQPNSSPSPIATQTPTLTPKPSVSPQPSSTNAFNPTLTCDTINYNGLTTPFSIPVHEASNGTSVSYSNIAILSGNSYNYLDTSSNGTVILSSNSINNRLINGNYSFDFGVTLTNPTASVNSSRPYEIQFVVTKLDATTASPSDIGLEISIENATNPIGVEFGAVPNYYTIPLTAYIKANTLTYLCNPTATENQQVSAGSIITSGFDQSLEMIISFGVAERLIYL